MVNTYMDRNMVSPGSRISAAGTATTSCGRAHPEGHHAGQQADHDGGEGRGEAGADAEGVSPDQDQIAHHAHGRRRQQQLPGWSVP